MRFKHFSPFLPFLAFLILRYRPIDWIYLIILKLFYFGQLFFAFLAFGLKFEQKQLYQNFYFSKQDHYISMNRNSIWTVIDIFCLAKIRIFFNSHTS